MQTKEKFNFLNFSLLQKPIICVSGAAEMGSCGAKAPEIAMELGRAIAKNGAIITTGATTGFPEWSASGAKQVGGISVGISPAANKEEHLETYKAPLEDMDFVMYTGFGYPMRDILLVRSSEAVIFGCGRIGTIHEFTIAFEDEKPIGILEGCWQTDEVIKKIIQEGNRPSDNVIFDDNPDRLVKRIIKMIVEKREKKVKQKMGWDL
jgi:uncharacterized protein (TIGR00725 family)